MKPSDSWYTTPDLLDRIERFFCGWAWLDPCASPSSPAWDWTAYHIEETMDCLTVPLDAWVRSVLALYMNPPYSNPAPFVARFLEAVRLVDRGVVLVNAATSTKWWQRLAAESDYMCFVSPRIRFLRARVPDHSDSKGNLVTDSGLTTRYTATDGTELVQPSSPRYANVIHGFGGTRAEFESVFGDMGVIR